MDENGKQRFDFPKGTKLIKYLIKLVPQNQNDSTIVLDFFAGSGTTGRAVLELNKEDNGTRKFILCVNDSGRSDEICEDCLRRVITGKTKKSDSNFEWLKTHKPLGGQLDIYEIKEISTKPSDKCILNEIDETDYDLPKFTHEIDKIEWICNNFECCSKTLVKNDNEESSKNND